MRRWTDSLRAAWPPAPFVVPSAHAFARASGDRSCDQRARASSLTFANRPAW